MEERDGTAARDRAADGADWQPVRSMDGHTYWFPPEIAYLAPGGAHWHELEVLLRLGLQARETAKATQSAPKRRGRRMGVTTAAAWEAFGVYKRNNPDFKPAATGRAMATRIARLAMREGLEGADTLDSDGTFGQMMSCFLKGYRRPVTKPKSTG